MYVLSLEEAGLDNSPCFNVDEYVNSLTVGVYGVDLVPLYVQDKLDHDGSETFQYSRFRNATKYELWIACTPTGSIEEANKERTYDSSSEMTTEEEYGMKRLTGRKRTKNQWRILTVLY